MTTTTHRDEDDHNACGTFIGAILLIVAMGIVTLPMDHVDIRFPMGPPTRFEQRWTCRRNVLNHYSVEDASKKAWNAREHPVTDDMVRQYMVAKYSTKRDEEDIVFTQRICNGTWPSNLSRLYCYFSGIPC